MKLPRYGIRTAVEIHHEDKAVGGTSQARHLRPDGIRQRRLARKSLRKAVVSIGMLFAAALSPLAGQELWAPDGLSASGIYSLATGPSGTRYAGTYDGVFRSTEAGVWTLLPNSPVQATVIAVDPSDPDTVYTGSFLSRGWGLHKSTDGGEHFQKLAGGVRCIAIDPVEPKTIYVGGDHPQVYKTTDGGASWTAPVSEGLVTRISSLVIDPSRPGTVYAGSDLGAYDYYDYDYYLAPTAPIIRSTDSGKQWTPVFEQDAYAVDPIYTQALAVDARTGALYAATWDDPGTSVFRSLDAGTTWERFSLGAAGSVAALVVDPASPNTLYAGTSEAGILRSVDAGSTWSPMNDGLPNLGVNALAFDPTDGMLRASDGNQVFAIRVASSHFPCTPSANHLCLLGSRYEVNVLAPHPKSSLVDRGVVVQGADRFGSFSFPAFTGDPAFPEVAVKMIDPAQGRGVWVFHGGLTNLPYILSVTDTTTGQIETYTNDSQNRFCGGADTEAFFENIPGPWDYAGAPAAESLARAENRTSAENGALSLLGNRFSVTLSAFSAYLGRTEPGVAVPGTDRYGYFSLPGFTGDPSFPEVYVKMVDFTAITGDFWFFHTGLTGLDYTLTVTDSVSGAVRIYEGRGDFCGGADVHAFTN